MSRHLSPPALLQAFCALVSAAKRGHVPPGAGEEHVVPNLGTRAPAHHRSSSGNVRWAYQEEQTS